MIIWNSGRGPRLLGCGTLVLASLVLMHMVLAVSGGSCTSFIFP